MSHVTPMQSSFNGGELSPRMGARIDQAIRQIAVKKMDGWLPLLQGPAEACPGTLRVAAAKVVDFVLVPFGFNVTQHYVLEISAGAIRFYTNEARIETAPGVAYEISAPWAANQLAGISYEQSGDVLYLYHSDMQTQKLIRTSAVTFTLSAVVYAGGPFEARNSDESITVAASNVWGDISLEASAAIFASGDVGGLFRIEASDLGTIGRWEPGITVVAGNLKQSPSIGAVYQALNSGKTGTVEPTHAEGVEYDGMASGVDANAAAAGGIQWLYLHDRYGLCRITGFTSATVVAATVIRRLPFMVATGENYVGGVGGIGGGGTYNPYEPVAFDPETYSYTPPVGSVTYTPAAWRWQFGSFSDHRGWPSCGAIWNERHCLGKDNVVHGSVVGDFENYAPLNEFGDPSADQAFQSILLRPDPARWMRGDTQLLIGTDMGEYALGPASAAGAVGPGNVAVASQSEQGAMAGVPVKIDGRVVFIQRARRRVVEFAYQLERDRFETPNLNRFADHIGTVGLKSLVFAQEPNQLLWAVRDDGTLACALFEPKEQALAWATRTLGGGMLAKSVCVIKDSNGEFDQLWIGVNNAAGTTGAVLRMPRPRLTGEEAQRQIILDNALIFEGTAIATITAPHLANLSVTALVDGVPMPLSLDGSGEADLPMVGDQVIVGLDFPATLTLMTIEAGGDSGPAQMKMGKISRVGLRLLDGRGLTVTAQGQSHALEQLITDTVMDREVAALVDDHWLQMVGTWDRKRELSITRTLPYPNTILAIMMDVDVQQHGGRI